MVDRLNMLMESRIHGDVYVRFGGEFSETCHRNMIRRWVLSLRLKADGYNFIEHKWYFEAEMPQRLVRATQLYRTLPHEFGHYVHYLEVVERPNEEDEDIEEWERFREIYHVLPSVEKESFAHNYADRLREELLAENLIPFDFS